ncbi:MAG: ATP-binding protein [Thermodesulfobacteriota bacterium]
MRRRLRWYGLLFMLFWSAMVGGSALWQSRLLREGSIGQARIQARDSVDKDLLYRRWASMHGGVYVPATEKTPPNPYLAHLPERDIVAPSGRQLTLVNPAYMTRQVHEMGREYGVKGHITSLDPINPGNAPDPWEREALQRLSSEESEVSAESLLDGRPHLRYLRRLAVEQGCLKCHAAQGYTLGETRGGISASVDLAPYLEIARKQRQTVLFAHLGIWLVGMGFSFGALWRLCAQAKAQESTEMALRLSEERFDLAARGASSGLWDWPDVEQDACWWSEQWLRLLGHQSGGLTPSRTTLRGLLHPDDLPRFEEALRLHWEEKVPFDLECRLRCKDGAYRWFRERGQALWDNQGRPRRMSGTLEDIHDRRLAEEALARSALEWSAAMDASEDVVYLLDCQRRILRGNQAFLRMVGVDSVEEAVGRHIVELIHPDGEAEPCPVCRAQVELRDFHLVMEADHPDNPAGRPIEIAVKIVQDPNGEPLSILMTLHDLTSSRQEQEERSRLEAQLRQAQKLEAIGTLAGGIAHDFNNILMPILGYSEIVLEQMEPGSELATDLAQVITATGRAKELVQQILAFSRQGEQEAKPIRVQSVVKETLKLMRASVPTTIEIRQEIDNGCEPVMADPVQIQQVVMNLCTNAYQAMREHGGVLSIRLSQVEFEGEEAFRMGLKEAGRYLHLAVADTGPGIPLAMQERIFEPYFTTKKQGEGTGLGLAVVHGIVKRLSGEIRVQSEPGQGTEFSIYLPVVSGLSQEGRVPAGPLPVGSEHLLLVDDEPDIVRLLSHQLGGLGYRITAFSDSIEALTTFRDRPEEFDLLITDMTMPRMTGAELAMEVLRVRPGMPVVLCTGFSDLITPEQAHAIGIRRFIMKPVIRRELAEAVRQSLDATEPARSEGV